MLARTYAERARVLFEELGDRATAGRLLNNLAGLEHLLGDTPRAIALLEEAFAIFVDLDLPVDAGYVCSSLAEIWLESGELELSEAQARKALDLLGDRVDHLQEVGTAQLTLGRALAAQGMTRRRGDVDLGGGRDVRARSLGGPSQLGLDRAGRRREPARGRPGCGRSLPARGACAAGRRTRSPEQAAASRHAPWRETGVGSRTRCR